jgi:hypothetical protein
MEKVLERLPRLPQDWWDKCEDREALLRRVLFVVIEQAYFPEASQSAASQEAPPNS